MLDNEEYSAAIISRLAVSFRKDTTFWINCASEVLISAV